MNYLSLEPFIPSGKDFEKSKLLFQELGFEIERDGGEVVSFRNGKRKLILHITPPLDRTQPALLSNPYTVKQEKLILRLAFLFDPAGYSFVRFWRRFRKCYCCILLKFSVIYLNN